MISPFEYVRFFILIVDLDIPDIEQFQSLAFNLETRSCICATVKHFRSLDREYPNLSPERHRLKIIK